MTRPASSSLILDGNDIKARLMAERTETQCVVHVDWLRFTCYLRNSPPPSVDRLFPKSTNIWDEKTRADYLTGLLQQLPEGQFSASAQALELAEEVCAKLGEGFQVATEVRKGHDFYARRWSIERNGSECGWVGYGSSSNSPRQQAQARTLHCNLYGAACTFAETGWRDRMATLIDLRKGDITRCDLALDYFDGMPGGMEQVVEDYKSGACDSGGKRLKCNMVGDWMNGRERSFYIGSKEAGKQTNVYEKGHQLYGAESGSPWMRVELRYGNKLRELTTDMLRRPADFFAGASDWHAVCLARADAIATPEQIKTTGRLALESVAAEVHRNLKWAFSVAAPTIAQAFKHLGEGFLQLVEHQKAPGRLSKFNETELAQAFAQVKHRFCPSDDGPSLVLAV